MTEEEIKLRRLAGQHLLRKSEGQTVVRDLCGVQAQFMANAVHALRIRCGSVHTGALVKNWTLRGTVHLFSQEDLPLFIGHEYYRLEDWSVPTWWNQREDWALTPDRQKYFSEVILAALGEGPLGREELKAVCRRAGMTGAEEGSMFHPWGGGIRELCERGFMHYAAEERKRFCLTPEFTPMPKETARLELARRYFTHFGPATLKDAAYFFGTTQREIKGLLDSLPVTAAAHGGKTFFYIEGGTPPLGEMPRCLFLAGFDQLMLGYEKKESLFLPREHLRGIFNRAGIVYPVLLVDGTVAGRWKMKNGKLTVTLFASAGQKQISDAASHLFHDLKRIEFS